MWEGSVKKTGQEFQKSFINGPPKALALNFRWKLTAVPRNLLFLNITQCHACTKGKRYVMSILLAS